MRQERQKGQLEAVKGPMFSGKTGELIDQMERQEIAGKVTAIFKPSIDKRYSVKEVVTHSGYRVDAHCVDKDNPQDILRIIQELALKGHKVNVVGIDEAQFFTSQIIEVVEELIKKGVDVVVAGLPTDFTDRDFGSMPSLIAKADKIIAKTAICTFQFEDGTRCGADATKTQRLVNGEPAHEDDPIILVGGKEAYEARCREHHFIHKRK